MKRMNGGRKSGIMRVAWACGALWCGGAAALETAGKLLIDLDAARMADVADGAALGAITNAGVVGGMFVPRADKAGAVYAADVAGRPAFTFPGTAGIMTNTVLPNARVTGNAPWSVEAWVYTVDIQPSSSEETYFSWTPREGLESNDRTVMECRYGRDNNNAFEHYTSNGEWDGHMPLAGVWHHLCSTYGADGVERVYVDGHPRSSKAHALRLAADGAFTLGGVWVRGGAYWGHPFSGALAKLRVHAGTLTAAQVRANYLAEVGTSLNRWVGADGADWQEAANWSQGRVPANEAVIDAGGRVRVAQDAAVASLQLPKGRLEVAGATLAVTGAVDDVLCAMGAAAALTVTGGGVYNVGTDCHVKLAAQGGTGMATVKAGGWLAAGRDLIVAYTGGTGALTVEEGGRAYTSNGWIYASEGVGARGRLVVAGGTLASPDAEKPMTGLAVSTGQSEGDLILDAGLIEVSESVMLTSWDDQTVGRGTLRLNGGRLRTGAVTAGSATNVVHFNGGVLEALKSGTLVPANLTDAFVDAGGLVVEVPEGLAATVAASLAPAPGAAQTPLRKRGAGRLVLSGANTVAAPWTLEAGSLVFATPDALAHVTRIDAAAGTALAAPWKGGIPALLARLDAAAEVRLVLMEENAADDVDLSARPKTTFATEGTFAYTGTYTPSAGATDLAFDVADGTMTYAGAVGGATRLVVTGTAQGRLVLTGANTATGGLAADAATVVFASSAAVPPEGPLALTRHARLDFEDEQDLGAIVPRVAAGSDGLLVVCRPTEQTADLNLTGKPGLVLGVRGTNVVYSGTITPGGGAYRFGGGNLPYNSFYRGFTVTQPLADVGGATRVELSDPGLVALPASSTYSGGTRISGGAALFVEADVFGAVPAEADPDNIVLDNGILRGGQATVEIPATRGMTVAAGGGRIHEWGLSAMTFRGDLHGEGPLTVSDSGLVTFGGAANDYTGALTVKSGGQVQIGTGDTFSWDAGTGAQVDGTLILKTDADRTLGQTFTGGGTLCKEGAGTLTLAGRQEAATTEVRAGTLRVARPEVIATAAGKGVLCVRKGGTFDTDGQALAVAALAGDGCVTNGSGAAAELRVGSERRTVAGEFSGTLADTLTLVKTGANTQTLSQTSASAPALARARVEAGVLALARSQRVGRVEMAGGALRVAGGQPGLTGRYYLSVTDVSPENLASLEAIEAFEAARVPDLVASSFATFGETFHSGQNGEKFPGNYRWKDFYVVIWRGYFVAPETGDWTFALQSDDGSVLYLDGAKVVDNNSDHGWDSNDQRVTTRKTVTLEKGAHEIVIGFYEKSGQNAVAAWLTRPGAAEDEALPQALLCDEAPSSAVTVKALTGDAGRIEFPEAGFATLALAEAGDWTLKAPLCGGNEQTTLRKEGAGTLTLAAGSGSYAGVVDVRAGALALGRAGQAGHVRLADGTTLEVQDEMAAGPGLRAAYYSDVAAFDYTAWAAYETMLADFAVRTPSVETTSASFGATLDTGADGARFHGAYADAKTDRFLLKLEGGIRLDRSGAWQFAVNSDDGAAVWIDGRLVVGRRQDTGPSGGFGSEGSPVELDAGLHEIVIVFREAGGGQCLRVAMKGPGDASFAYIPQTKLTQSRTALTGLSGAAASCVDLGARALYLEQKTETVFAGRLAGTASARLLKDGVAACTLSGDLSDFQGTLQVDGGELRLASGGTVAVAALAGAPTGTLVVDGGTDVRVLASSFRGTVDVRNGTFTVVPSGTKHLSGFFGSLTGGTLAVDGAGTLYFDLPAGALGAKTVRLAGGATGRVANAAQLGGAAVALAGGTLLLQREVAAGGVTLADFTPSSGWQFNESAGEATDGFMLTPCENSRKGSVFRKETVDVGQAWVAAFSYTATTNGVDQPADGFSFMVQREGATVCGGEGGCLGGALAEYDRKVITPAVAVTTKIFPSLKMGVAKNGEALFEADVPGIDRLKPIAYTVTYDGARLAFRAEQGGVVFERTCDLDLVGILGGAQAHVGFTAGTGGSIARQVVAGFRMSAAAETDAQFDSTRVDVDGAGTLATQHAEARIGALGLAPGAAFTLAPAAGIVSETAYTLAAGVLATAPGATIAIQPNGAQPGTLVVGTLDARAGGPVTVTGGRLAAPDGALKLIVATPTERGVTRLLDLRASAWTGPLAITVVDGADAPVKGKAYLSGGVLKFDTTTGTALILR